MARTSSTGSGTSIANDATVAHGGTHSLLTTDDSSTESGSQQAAIEYSLASGRFEWKAEAWIRPSVLDLPIDPNNPKQVYLLHFLDAGGANLSVASRLKCNASGLILAGIAAKKPNGTTGGKDSTTVIGTGVWLKWAVRLLRVGTRETTAVLFLGDDGELMRYTWDSSTNEPLTMRVGVGQSLSKVKATLNTDDVLVTEKTM